MSREITVLRRSTGRLPAGAEVSIGMTRADLEIHVLGTDPKIHVLMLPVDVGDVRAELGSLLSSPVGENGPDPAAVPEGFVLPPAALNADLHLRKQNGGWFAVQLDGGDPAFPRKVKFVIVVPEGAEVNAWSLGVLTTFGRLRDPWLTAARINAESITGESRLIDDNDAGLLDRVDTAPKNMRLPEFERCAGIVVGDVQGRLNLQAGDGPVAVHSTDPDTVLQIWTDHKPVLVTGTWNELASRIDAGDGSVTKERTEV